MGNGIWPSAPCNGVIAIVRARSMSNSRWKMLAIVLEGSAYAAEQSSWCGFDHCQPPAMLHMDPMSGRKRSGKVPVAAERRICACLVWRCIERVEGLYFPRADAQEKTS